MKYLDEMVGKNEEDSDGSLKRCLEWLKGVCICMYIAELSWSYWGASRGSNVMDIPGVIIDIPKNILWMKLPF